jgi:hypothetical protein
MFKKTLLALTVAGLSLNAAASVIDAGGLGDLTTNQQLISLEGSAGSTTIVISAANPITVDTTLVTDTVEGLYTTLAKLKVTITGGTLVAGSSLNIDFVDADGATTTLVGTVEYLGNVAILTLNAASVDLFDGDNTLFAKGDNLVVSGLTISPTGGVIDSATAISLTVEVLDVVNSSVTDISTGVIASVVTQFSAAITELGDNAVDVGDARLSFIKADDGTEVLTDSSVITVSSKQVDLLPADATAEKATSVLVGSFGFLDTNADGKVTAADAGTTTASINAAFTTATLVGAATGFDGAAPTNSALTTSFAVDGITQTLAPQTFTSSVSFDYADALGEDQTFTASLAAGAWTLNGDTALIPYMPFDSAFAQSITVTNNGIVDGAITVDITANGETNTHILTEVAVANTVTNITAGVKAAAATDGVTGNAAITVVTNSPSNDITVSALYYSKADADRGS